MLPSSPWVFPSAVHAELVAALGSGPDGLLLAARFVLDEFGGLPLQNSPVGLAAALGALSAHVDVHLHDGVPLDVVLLERHLRRVLAVSAPSAA